jgi:ribosome-associated protein
LPQYGLSFGHFVSKLSASRSAGQKARPGPAVFADSRSNQMTTPVSQPDAQAPNSFRVVEISREPIELYKILKFEGMAGSGGEAKAAVASGEVLVNGKRETQKRKKIVSGDRIEFNDEKICIKLSSPISENTALPGKNVNTEAEAQGSAKE